TSAGAFPAFLARPTGEGPAPAVLVIMEAFGLNAHIKDVARRLAAEGYVALAPDLYWRGGKGRTVRYDQLPEAIALMQSLKDAEVVVYPKAPHGFFCNERDSYRPEAARDAWERLRTFLATHLKR